MNKKINTDHLHSKFELKTVLETSRMLIEARDVDFVLNNLLLILMGKLLIGRAAVFLFDPKTGKYRVTKQKGVTAISEGDILDFKLTSQDLKTPYFYYQDHPEGLPILTADMQNSLFINLRTSSQHLGFLFLAPKTGNNPYSKHELEFAEGLCIISTATLANSQLFNELKNTNRKLDQRIHELNTLFDLSKEFNLLVDREKISRIFKFALLGQLFVRTFFLIYKNQGDTDLLASSGLKTTVKKGDHKLLFNKADDGVYLVDDALKEEFPFLKENQIAALIGISIQNEQVAVIGVGERVNKVPFAETDFNFLKSLANLAVISIQKTYFLEERIDKERMEEELSIAKSIQEGLLPDPIPKIDGVDLSAKTISSREVGGDYFDVAETPDGNTILAIADVTGKGVPAALLMANLQSMLHVLLPVDITLSEATERINNLIYKNSPADKFITFFWGKYICDHKIFRYVNAGHNPTLLLRKDENTFSELSDGGLLLGALETMSPYLQNDIQLNPGDIMVFYTDGVNEALDLTEKEEYGIEKMQECVIANRHKSSEEILQAIVDDVKEFSGEKLYDDLTLLIFKASC